MKTKEKTAYEKLLDYLKSPKDWQKTDYVEEDNIIYYKFAPEIYIDREIKEETEFEMKMDYDNREFYHFNQRSAVGRRFIYIFNFYYNGTKIVRICADSLSEGEYIAPTPKPYYFSKKDDYGYAIKYRWFVKDSIEYVFKEFYDFMQLSEKIPGDHRFKDSKNNFMNCVLIFENEEEKLDFNEYVKENIHKLAKIDENQEKLLHDKWGDKNMVPFIKEYSDAQVLRKMLLDFREIK